MILQFDIKIDVLKKIYRRNGFSMHVVAIGNIAKTICLPKKDHKTLNLEFVKIFKKKKKKN
jgi:hypothetical protein